MLYLVQYHGASIYIRKNGTVKVEPIQDTRHTHVHT